MLEELHVENLGIIRSARIEPGPGLVAVTGETGAGKTLLLGALALLRGDPARSDRIGPHGAEALAEGRFSIGPAETVVARRVAEGKSRAYLDGAMVPARALAERLDALVEIVAQHEHVALGQESSVRRLIDGLLDDAGNKTEASYRQAWERLSGLRADRAALGGDPRAMARDLDLARHQAAEISAARLHSGEEEALKATLGRLRHAGELIETLGTASISLDDEGGASDALRSALGHLEGAARIDPALQELVGRLRTLVTEADELGRDLRGAADGIDHDPGALMGAEERAAALAGLRRKYGATIDEVISFGAEAAERAARLEQLTDRAANIATEITAAETAAQETGEALAGHRRRAGERLVKSARKHLQDLGFRDPVLIVEVESSPPGPHGADRLRLLFASDSGLTPGPVGRVASGGELSRLVLAIRVAAGVADAEVVAFDEIDAGVGGSTALAMGELLARLARGRQVLVVTHLPQVAAFADAHIVVERAGREAAVRRLDGDERVAEISRMLGGIGESDSGREHAAELLALAATRRGGAHPR